VRKDFKLFLTDFGSALVKGHQDDPNGIPASYSGPSGGFYKAVMDGTTMLYAAPEVLHNQHASQASDVYSLGMCLAELATG
jgi:serine/threonine protein kinase